MQLVRSVRAGLIDQISETGQIHVTGQIDTTGQIGLTGRMNAIGCIHFDWSDERNWLYPL